jgi:hypothetical protein
MSLFSQVPTKGARVARTEMLTQKAPAREAAKLWPHWSPSARSDALASWPRHTMPASPSPGEGIDGQIESFLSSLRVLTGADEFVLSLQGADDEELTAYAIGRSGLSSGACRRVAECGPVAMPLGGEAIWP